MSRLEVKMPAQAQSVIEQIYSSMERRISANPPGLCPVDMTLNLAYERLSLAMEGEVPEGALLRKSVKEIWAEEGLTLHCQGEFLENIAQIKEIEIDGTKNRKN